MTSPSTAHRCAHRDLKREIGFSLSAAARYPKHTARQHLRWQARLAGIGVDDVESVLAEVGLESAATRLVGDSPRDAAAPRDRVGAAGRPKTLVLDEPANGLDVEGILWLRELFARLAARSKTVPSPRTASARSRSPRRGSTSWAAARFFERQPRRHARVGVGTPTPRVGVSGDHQGSVEYPHGVAVILRSIRSELAAVVAQPAVLRPGPARDPHPVRSERRSCRRRPAEQDQRFGWYGYRQRRLLGHRVLDVHHDGRCGDVVLRRVQDRTAETVFSIAPPRWLLPVAKLIVSARSRRRPSSRPPWRSCWSCPVFPTSGTG